MFQYLPSGDSAFIIKTGNEISEDINRKVRKLLIRIEQEKIAGITDLIPSYNELLVCYDPSVTGYRKILDTLRSLEAGIDTIGLPQPSIIYVPVLYGGESGPDLHEVADINKLTEQEVISIHCSVNYLVYMLGFTPGFCYLGGMDKRIVTPRKKNPRIKIPAGSVGIAYQQTGIYPVESPGGWHLIGKTPLRLFNPGKKPEFLFSSGNYIRFFPVSEEEYRNILREVDDGSYRVKKTRYS